jgi:DNA polymerase-3 subunit delta'
LKPNDFFGMPDYIENLIADFQAGTRRHAYLFSGAKGTGKRSIARLCARIAHCVGAEKPCGTCAMCRVMDADAHPDHIVVRPDKSIGIDAIRDVLLKLARKSFEGGAYTVIIEQADKMTVQAQNALLKTLESPVGDVVFFLLTDAQSALLKTIVSRAEPVRFSGVSDEMLLRALADRGASPEKAAAVLLGAHGSVGRALELLADDAYQDARGQVWTALKAAHAPERVIGALEPLAAATERAGDILDIMEDIAREQLTAPGASYDLALPYDPALLLMRVAQARKRLSSNVRWQSALETMFFSLLE